MKNKHIDDYSKEELKDEVLFLRLDQAGDHHYAEMDRQQSVFFQAHLLVNRIIPLEEIMKHNANQIDFDKVNYLTAMVHDLYNEIKALESYIENEDRDDSIKVQMERGRTREEAEVAYDEWKATELENKGSATINLRELIAQKKEASV